jgi:hypothetical protein
MSRRTPPPVEREQRELACTLTDTQVRERGEQQSAAELEIERLKSQRKGLTGAISDLAEKRNALAHVIDTRVEQRMVDCAWIADYAAGLSSCVRQDTGEVIEQRPITNGERQTGLPLDVAAPVPGDDLDDEAPAPAPVTQPARRRGANRKPPVETVHTYE